MSYVELKNVRKNINGSCNKAADGIDFEFEKVSLL